MKKTREQSARLFESKTIPYVGKEATSQTTFPLHKRANTRTLS